MVRRRAGAKSLDLLCHFKATIPWQSSCTDDAVSDGYVSGPEGGPGPGARDEAVHRHINEYIRTLFGALYGRRRACLEACVARCCIDRDVRGPQRVRSEPTGRSRDTKGALER